MVIYIVLEIAVRELPGNLLLATLAASKGHQVFIGTSNDLWLYKRLKILPVGAYIVKNMNMPAFSEKLYSNFKEDGFDIYCHEAEPSILWSDFQTFLEDHSINCNQALPFKGVFCWGERDYKGYSKLFENQKDVFAITGSPRVDLWSPRLKEFWERDYINSLKPYVLYVSNNSWTVGKRHWSKYLEIQRNLELVTSVEHERNLYDIIKKDILMVESAVFSLRELALKYPNINFIIRPHPMDNETYWNDAIGEYENIKVIYKESITPWIAGATALIHNSCTSAIEAAIQGIPVISYVPSETSDILGIANKCGIKVSNHAELDEAVKYILENNSDIKQSNSNTKLLEPLISIGDKLSSIRIIEEIEKKSMPLKGNKLSGTAFVFIYLIKQTKSFIDKFRDVDLSNQKNMEFNKKEVEDSVEKFSTIFDVPCPKIRFASNTTVLIGCKESISN